MDEQGALGWRAVEAARGWIGTPYVHGASVRGAGADCLGLVRGVWRELFGREAQSPPIYGTSGGDPDEARLLALRLAAHAKPTPPMEIADGDILLIAIATGRPARHLGLAATDCAAGRTMIHAYSGRGVVESPLGESWLRRVVAAFRIPENE